MSGPRRRRGSGGLLYLPEQKLWRAVIDLPPEGGRRRQWMATSRHRENALAKLHAKMAELGRFVDESPAPPARSRYQLLVEARARGRHTPQELRSLWRSRSKCCRYCGVRLDVLENSVVDHITPVARGGSDAIGNLQIICWECNVEKADSLAYEYQGPRPRPFRQRPERAHAS